MMRMKFKFRLSEPGFTLVELIVAITAAAVFIVAFSQLHATQAKVSSNMSSYTTADSLAYNNLRTYANGKSPSWFTCNYSGGNPLPMTVFSSTAAVTNIDPPVTQSVIATAPYGCGGGSSGIGYPIKVVSTVTFGPNAKAVVHATYSTY